MFSKQNGYKLNGVGYKNEMLGIKVQQLRLFQILQKMSIESLMIKYINLARQFPNYYTSLINKQIQSFINDKEMPITQEMIYQTNQGKNAWIQAKFFLEKQSSLPPFEVHQGLNLSAKAHAQDLASHNLFGHIGSDKSTFSERILKYCRKGQGAMAQIIGADFQLEGRNNAEMTILGLIIDDGVTDRGHRKTIFNTQYRYIGCKSEIQGDKVITIFNLTQNKLNLRNEQASTNEAYQYAHSTMPLVKQPKLSNTGLLNKTQIENFGNILTQTNNGQKSVFNELSQNQTQLKPSFSLSKTGSNNLQVRANKKIKERKQNTKIYYDQGSKITQNHIQIYYTDGTFQENMEKHTIYS